MTIPEVRQKKIKLEHEILELIKKFEEETEASIARIELKQAGVLGSYQLYTVGVDATAMI